MYKHDEPRRKRCSMCSTYASNYNREKALAYASKWALKRNPAFGNFNGIGGDCTNFISQCLYAGCGIMNYTKDLGWYYSSMYNRAPAWTGVDFLFRFLTTNKKTGPFASKVNITDLVPGDIVQLGDASNRFYHSLFVLSTGNFTYNEVFIATHSIDVYNKPLAAYDFYQARFLHIEGARG